MACESPALIGVSCGSFAAISTSRRTSFQSLRKGAGSVFVSAWVKSRKG